MMATRATTMSIPRRVESPTSDPGFTPCSARDAVGSPIPAGGKQFRDGARSVVWRRGTTAPLVEDAVLLVVIDHRHVAQSLVDVVGELGDNPGQPPGQPLDGGAAVQLGT